MNNFPYIGKSLLQKIYQDSLLTSRGTILRSLRFVRSRYTVRKQTTSFPGSSLFLPQERTLVAAGHVSARFLQIPEI